MGHVHLPIFITSTAGARRDGPECLRRDSLSPSIVLLVDMPAFRTNLHDRAR